MKKELPEKPTRTGLIWCLVFLIIACSVLAWYEGKSRGIEAQAAECVNSLVQLDNEWKVELNASLTAQGRKLTASCTEKLNNLTAMCENILDGK